MMEWKMNVLLPTRRRNETLALMVGIVPFVIIPLECGRKYHWRAKIRCAIFIKHGAQRSVPALLKCVCVCVGVVKAKFFVLKI